MDDEVNILKRKLAETEERLAARMINSISSFVDADVCNKIKNMLLNECSFDALETERNISCRAVLIAESLQYIHEAAIAYKKAKTTHDIISNDIAASQCCDNYKMEKLQAARDLTLCARQKLFSLLDEHEIKKSFDNELSQTDLL